MDNQEKKYFKDFEKEINKFDVLDNQTAEMLLNRYISRLTTRRFLNPYLKRRYYSFWFKILVGKGKLKPMGLGYKVVK